MNKLLLLGALDSSLVGATGLPSGQCAWRMQLSLQAEHFRKLQVSACLTLAISVSIPCPIPWCPSVEVPFRRWRLFPGGCVWSLCWLFVPLPVCFLALTFVQTGVLVASAEASPGGLPASASVSQGSSMLDMFRRIRTGAPKDGHLTDIWQYLNRSRQASKLS